MSEFPFSAFHRGQDASERVSAAFRGRQSFWTASGLDGHRFSRALGGKRLQASGKNRAQKSRISIEMLPNRQHPFVSPQPLEAKLKAQPLGDQPNMRSGRAAVALSEWVDGVNFAQKEGQRMGGVLWGETGPCPRGLFGEKTARRLLNAFVPRVAHPVFLDVDRARIAGPIIDAAENGSMNASQTIKAPCALEFALNFRAQKASQRG